MDVSRIEAQNPNLINWRQMTAKQIIKKDNEGIDVPSQYINWAREFINSIYSDDITTYEIAASGQNDTQQNQTEVENVQSENQTKENSETVDEKKPQLSEAQLKRKEMTDNGDSIIKQAIYFSQQSQNLYSESFTPVNFLLPGFKNASNEELVKLTFTMLALNADMENIFSNLKNIAALNKVKNSEDNNDSIVQRAYEEGQKLTQTAQQGHKFTDKTESNMDSIGGSMASFVPTFDKTIDYGEQTTDIGSQLSNTGIWYYIRDLVINSGQQAEKMGNIGLKNEGESQNLNNKNLDNANNFHSFIAAKSGVESSEPHKDYKRDKRGVSEAEKKEEKKKEAEKIGQSEVDKIATNVDSKQKEDIKKEDRDLPADRETLVKLQDEDRNVKGNFVKNASKTTTVQDAPSKKEFADDNEQTEAKNEFEKAKSNDGADERMTVMNIRAKSINADNQTLENIGIASELAKLSQNAYNKMDTNIQDLMNEINRTQEEIKNEIRSVNTGMSGDISKINSLNEELRRYGQSAQSVAGSYGQEINSYSMEVNNIGDIFNSAIESGSEAIQAGNSLINSSADRWLAFRLVNEIIGTSAINAGTKALNDGHNGLKNQSEASSIINDNLSGVYNLQAEIQDKTGVEGTLVKTGKEEKGNSVKPPEDETIKENESSLPLNKEPETEQIKRDPITGKKKESEKSVKTAQNDGTDTTDKLNINIDEILKRKVRRGEVKMG